MAAVTLNADVSEQHPEPGRQIVKVTAAASADTFVSKFAVIDAVELTTEVTTNLTGPSATFSGGTVTVAWTGAAANVPMYLVIYGRN